MGVKCSQFSFARLHQADPVSGVDMASTGEVGCLGRSSDEALLKAMLSVGHRVPAGPVLLSTGDAFRSASSLVRPMQPTSPVDAISTPDTGSA